MFDRRPPRAAYRPVIAAIALVGTLTAPARADTLEEALAAAYGGNPTLTAERANLAATSEGVAIARAGGRPNVAITAQYAENILTDEGGGAVSFTPSRQLTGGLQLTLPLFQGGAVRNSIRAARSRVDAGRALLRATESDVFTQVVAAYMDVIRTEAIVGLNRQQVELLRVNLEATRDRFEIGDLTRTDVAQSEARYSGAQADAQAAEADLITARETYIRVVGRPPAALAPPPPLPNLPASADEAVGSALQANPDLIAAQAQRFAARSDVRVAGAERLPSLSAFSAGNYANNFGSIDAGGLAVDQSSLSGQIGLSATIPLYQGGRPAAQVRQAEALFGRAQELEIAAERAVIANTRAAFASYRAAMRVIQSAETAVSANRLALEGVQAENSVGNRTIIEILNAQQELLNSEVQLVTARRNAYVAGFNLLAAMGRAEARDLGFESGALYDPESGARRAEGWSDFDSGPLPEPRAGRTVDSPAQDAEIGPPR